MCYNSFDIFVKPRFLATNFRNPLGFSYIQDMLKTSAFQNKRIASENFSGVSGNRPQLSHFDKTGESLLRNGKGHGLGSFKFF